MHIIWIRAFLEVSQSMNFSEAASKLYISQPSLSKYIKSIEEELGVALFKRTTRQVVLTEAGKSFASHAEGIISAYDNMLTDMRNQRSKADNHVRIACVPAVHIYGHSDLFLNFSKDYPMVDMELTEVEMDTAMSLLNEGKVDLAVVRSNLVDNPKEFNTIEFNWDELLVICNEEHRFAKYHEVTLEEAVAEKLVLIRYAVPEFRRVFKLNGITPDTLQPSIQSTNYPIIEKYLINGVGISITTKSLAKEYDSQKKLVTVPLKGNIGLTIGMIYRGGDTNLTSACQDLIKFTRKYVGSLDKSG